MWNKNYNSWQDLDIIEDAEDPTPWVSPIVAVPKFGGEICECVDMRQVNEAVVRERHPIPTSEETLQAMNSAKVSSKLDLRLGYHQIELHPDSASSYYVLYSHTPQTVQMPDLRLILCFGAVPVRHSRNPTGYCTGAQNISDDIKLYSAKIRNRTTAVCKRLSNGLKSLGSL